jgi:hypothetical protein
VVSIRIESSEGNQPIKPNQAEQLKSASAPVEPAPAESVHLSISPSALEATRGERETAEVKSDGDEIDSHAKAMDSVSWIRGQILENPSQAMASHGDSAASSVMQLLA